jgi:hypothetical protein
MPAPAGRSGVGEDDLLVIDGLLGEHPALGYKNLPEADMPARSSRCTQGRMEQRSSCVRSTAGAHPSCSRGSPVGRKRIRCSVAASTRARL